MESLIHVLSAYNNKQELQVIIDIPTGSSNKYEYDHEFDCIRLDRVLSVPMAYPFEYGSVPQTLAEDDDPIDVVVYTTHPTVPGCVMNVRPIGVLYTEDEAGIDPKIICVPTKKIDPRFAEIEKYQDLGQHRLDEMRMFFKEYKHLEKEKYDKIVIGSFDSKERAEELIQEAMKRYKTHK
ncbi:inorganic pyrophosphatase [Candidatus Peregrinibacteria bacterium]|nr:MAG: inorganic pyrophosphatase [Candidatus Peregrinibacteria bacterium]